MSNGTSTATIRLGAIGLGWIGLQRLLRVRDTALPGGSLDIVSLCDCSDEALHIACEAMPQAWACQDLEEMLSFDLDGILIATPSALHAAQAQRCLEAGTAVFCQKPLARDASEARQVIDAARLNDRLLGVDFSYRHLRASEQLKTAIQSGSIGTIYAMDLIFHNAYGPDKEWFYDIERSGGGCMMDLGIHLFDLALWCLDFPDIANVAGRRWHQGRALAPGERTVEDYATATMLLADGAECRCTTSWNMHAGRDAVIEAHVHGRDGGLSLTNIGGSFYDFCLHQHNSTDSTCLIQPPDDWMGRAAVAWAAQLLRDPGYDPSIEQAAIVADCLDAAAGRSVAVVGSKRA